MKGIELAIILLGYSVQDVGGVVRLGKLLLRTFKCFFICFFAIFDFLLNFLIFILNWVIIFGQFLSRVFLTDLLLVKLLEVAAGLSPLHEHFLGA